MSQQQSHSLTVMAATKFTIKFKLPALINFLLSARRDFRREILCSQPLAPTIIMYTLTCNLLVWGQWHRGVGVSPHHQPLHKFLNVTTKEARVTKFIQQACGHSVVIISLITAGYGKLLNALSHMDHLFIVFSIK